METKLTDVGLFNEQIDRACADTAVGDFNQKLVYNDRIDSLVFFLSDELSYRKRVNALLTAHISDSTGEVVGIEIKGFRRAIENMRRFDSDWVVHNHPSLGFWLGIAVNTPDNGIEWIDSDLPGIEKYSHVSIPKEYYEVQAA